MPPLYVLLLEIQFDDNDDAFVKKSDVGFLFIQNERERASEDAYLNFE